MAPAALGAARGASGSNGAVDLPDMPGSLVVVVDDVRADAVSIMVGEQEIVVRDRELVARLLRAATS